MKSVASCFVMNRLVYLAACEPGGHADKDAAQPDFPTSATIEDRYAKNILRAAFLPAGFYDLISNGEGEDHTRRG